jgi:hypothetical protein
VRYADDFVVLVAGTREQAEPEKQALATFLKEELRMELSIEKTKITEVREGFDFLGYRVVQAKARRNGRLVGKPFIPKGKLKDLRRSIKALVRETPTGKPLAYLIKTLNPIITGWRNYYRYAAWACRDFAKLGWWLRERIGRWVRKKHRKASWRQLQRRFLGRTRGDRWRWRDGAVQMRFFWEGGTSRFPNRGTRIPNGWNVGPEERFQSGAAHFWSALNTLAKI